MLKSIKRTTYRILGTENYLRTMQQGYFAMYRTGLLRNNPEYELHYFVKNLIKEGDTVLDIGANLGYYSLLFAEWVGKRGHVYAVEPIKLYNKIFTRKARKKQNITLLPYALGSEEKQVSLVMSPTDGYMRSGLPHVYDALRDGDLENQQFRFECTMKRPQSLFADIPRIDYIKCDVEGFEYIVLHEMRDLIARHKPMMQVELWEQNIKRTIALLGKMGYVPYRLNKKSLLVYDLNNPSGHGDFIFMCR